MVVFACMRVVSACIASFYCAPLRERYLALLQCGIMRTIMRPLLCPFQLSPPPAMHSPLFSCYRYFLSVRTQHSARSLSTDTSTCIHDTPISKQTDISLDNPAGNECVFIYLPMFHFLFLRNVKAVAIISTCTFLYQVARIFQTAPFGISLHNRMIVGFLTMCLIYVYDGDVQTHFKYVLRHKQRADMAVQHKNEFLR